MGVCVIKVLKYLLGGEPTLSLSDSGGLMVQVLLSMVGEERHFFLNERGFLLRSSSSPVPSLPSEGDWLRTGGEEEKKRYTCKTYLEQLVIYNTHKCTTKMCT